MKIAIVSHSASKGGAALASTRLFCALGNFKNLKYNLDFITPDKNKNLISRKLNDIFWKILLRFSYYIKRFFFKNNSFFFSLGFFSRIKVSELNDCNVLNLHWINNSTFSINLINKFNKPIVWTLHDCWPILGLNHHCNDSEFVNYIDENYQFSKANSLLQFFDKLNLKRKNYVYKGKNKDLIFVSPTKWLLNRAKKSFLTKNCKILHIPNPYNENQFFLSSEFESKKYFNIKAEDFVVCFGAKNFLSDMNKGWDLVYSSLKSLPEYLQNKVTLITFGDKLPTKSISNLKLKKIINFPFINDYKFLNKIYNASNLLIFPSRNENMPQVVVEALACGCRVYAYKVGGIPELVISNAHGKIFKPFVNMDFSEIISNYKYTNNQKYRKEISDYAKSKWSSNVIAEKYNNLFLSLLDRQK